MKRELFLYRICQKRFANDFYTTKSNSYKNGGRWNLPKSPVLYTSMSPSVAMLEMSNYMPAHSLSPMFGMCIYSIPTNMLDKLDEVPETWREINNHKDTMKTGTNWLNGNTNLGLIVPSATVANKKAYNVIINPLNSNINKLKLVEIINGPDIFDQRILKRLKKETLRVAKEISRKYESKNIKQRKA